MFLEQQTRGIFNQEHDCYLKTKERQAVKMIRQIQRFAYDNSIKTKGLSLTARIEQTRQLQKGTCTTKHELLAHELIALDYNLIFLTYPFWWHELEVDFPENLRELAAQMPKQYHLALGLIKGARVEIIDVTWDPELKKAGFPLVEEMQSLISTPLAVVPAAEPKIHWTNQQKDDYIQHFKKTIPWSKVIPRFYQQFNQWLKSLRSTDF